MSTFIDLSKSKYIDLPFLNESEAKKISNQDKGWSFSYVYHFTELRDIYIALTKYSFEEINIKYFTKHCLAIKLPFIKTPWTERRVLEHLNAWKNFDFIDSNYFIKQKIFENSEIGHPLLADDLSVFRHIYFSYFRFKEIHSWLLDPYHTDHLSAIESVKESILISNSKVIFPFFKSSRFTDCFLFSLENNTDVFCIRKFGNQNNEDLMRFWDVYIKWGQSLGLIEKFSLKELDYHFSASNKSASCAYFVSDMEISDFNLLDFIKQEYNSKYIHIPRLIFRIATKFRLPVDLIKNEVIKQALNNGDIFSLQRTSEVFIRNKEMNFVPIHKDSYISHLLLQ